MVIITYIFSFYVIITATIVQEIYTEGRLIHDSRYDKKSVGLFDRTAGDRVRVLVGDDGAGVPIQFNKRVIIWTCEY